jgi:hypothetical protein
MIFFGQASLQHAVSYFVAHYHIERNHQGLANRLAQPSPTSRHLGRCIGSSVSVKC